MPNQNEKNYVEQRMANSLSGSKGQNAIEFSAWMTGSSANQLSNQIKLLIAYIILVANSLLGTSSFLPEC